MMPDELFPVTTTVAAQDQNIATVLMTSPADQDRALVQLSYWTGTNSASSIPGFFLMPPVSLRGSITLDLSGSNVFGYQVVAGPTAASGSGSVGEQHQVFPSHAKANLQPILIPAGWMLAMAPLDADMNGTINVRLITQLRRRG